MNRFKCPACGGEQYTACNKAKECIYCGNNELQKMDTLEPEDGEDTLAGGNCEGGGVKCQTG